MQIKPISEIVRMEKFNYLPNYIVVAPTGNAKVPRDMFDAGRDFKFNLLQYRMNQFTQFTKWAVFCSQDLTGEVLKVLEEFTKCGNHFKYLTTPPDCFFVEKDTLKDWVDGMKKQLTKEHQAILCFTKSSKSSLISEVMDFNIPFLVEKLPLKAKLCNIYAHSLMHRLAACRNDHPWSIAELTESNPTVFGAFRFSKVGTQSYLSLVFSKNKMFTKFFQQITQLDEENINEQVKQFLISCNLLFKQKVVNTEFFALCYLTHDNKDQAMYGKVRQSLHKNLINFSPKSYALVESYPINSIELYPVTTRSVQEYKILTYRNFEEFYLSKKKAFKYFPECLSHDISKSGGLAFLLFSRRSYFSSAKGEINKYEVIAHHGIQSLEMIKRWVLERTVLLGNVDFLNPGKFWGLPAPVTHSLEIERVVKSGTQLSGEELVKRVNKFDHPLYYC
jgi:hypothetical protein